MSVFGVDFGCLNSCVAITRNGGIDIVVNEVSKRDTYTVVSLTDQERCIGETGFDRFSRNVDNTIFCLKYWIGMKVTDEDFEREKRFLFCKTTSDADGRVKFVVKYDGQDHEFYPEQILAMFLCQLRSFAEKEASKDVKRGSVNISDCVIGIPNWYTPDQRQCVMQASEIAGIHCMSLVNESTLVAVDYGIFRGASLPEKEEEGNNVMMVDIGFGHTTASVCRFWKGNVRVISRFCDKKVSTREIDYLLLEHFAALFKKKHNIDVLTNKRARLRVLQAVDKVKQMLSANSVAPLSIECLMGDFDININLTRVEFEELITPIINMYKTLISETLKDSNVPLEKLHSIEMIGGGCRIPMFKKATEEVFSKPPSFTVNATESVARGAAITAAVLSPLFQVREFVVYEFNLLPIKAGHSNPNCEKPANYSFLPGVNDVVTLLDYKDYYPKVLDVTIKRRDEFTFYIFFDDKIVPNAAQILRNNFKIGEWKIGSTNVENCDGIIKIRVQLLSSGLVRVDSAHTSQIVEYDATEEKKDPEHPENPPEKITVKKTKKVRIPLSVTEVHVLGHKKENVETMRKFEIEMHKRDMHILKKKETKNALEAHIIENRNKVTEEGGIYYTYISEKDRIEFANLANQYENWLYNEGSDNTLEEYSNRLMKLKSLSDPAVSRFKVHDDCAYEIKEYNNKLRKLQETILEKSKKRPSHIKEEEYHAAYTICEEAIKFGQQGLLTLQQQVKCEEPKFSFQKLKDKYAEVVEAIKIIDRAAPAPPPAPPVKVTPVSPDTNEANMTANTNNNADNNATNPSMNQGNAAQDSQAPLDPINEETKMN